MQEVNIKTLKTGDLLFAKTEGHLDNKFSKISASFARYGIILKENTPLVFEYWDENCPPSEDNCIIVSYNKNPIRGYFPKRFWLAKVKTKKEQLLDKINILWKRQPFYKEYYGKT
jgi:hypothetical protein